MRSIPLAVFSGMLRRGRWYLLGSLLAGNLLPAMVFSALNQEGGFDPTHESAIMLHFFFTQINLLIFGSAVYSALGHPKRMYAYPLTNSAIVVWQLVPAMMLMALGSVITTLFLNTVFNVAWPLWGPVLFSAVAFASVAAMVWLTEKSGWALLGLTVVAGFLGLWIKSRYGSPFSQPNHFWLEVTSGDVATMLAIGLAAFCIGVLGVARSRRGDPLPSLGIVAWWQRVFDPEVDTNTRFKSASRAQFWFEWRQKGWAIPAAVLFAMLVNFIIWCFISRNIQELIGGLIAGGGLLGVAGFVGGFLLGNTGPTDAAYEMGQFLATRPLGTTQMARTILKTAAYSVLLAWTLWAVAYAAVRFAFVLAGSAPLHDIPQVLGWWYFPVTLLSPWIVAGVLTSLGLTGRSTLIAKIFCGLFTLWIALTLFAKFALTEQARLQLSVLLTAAIGLAFVLATIWIFVAAHRRSLIESLTVCLAVVVWVAASIVVAVTWSPSSIHSLAIYAMIVGLLALTVVPFAAAPLALSWNRNR